MLPYVKIDFKNGVLGSTSPSDDGVVGLIASGTAIDKLVLGEVNLLTSLKDLEELGVKEKPVVIKNSDDTEETIDNSLLYKTVREFYSEAPTNAKLWLMVVDKDVTVTEMFRNEDYAKKLVVSANGSINLLITKKIDGATPTDEDLLAEINSFSGHAIEPDVYAAMKAANNLAEDITENYFAPFFVILEGRHYTGVPAKLKDLGEESNNRVGILIADTKADTNGACVGLLAGRIASIPVQRSIARVKTGAINASGLFIKDKVAEEGKPDVIHEYNYITARTFVGKAGYYWSDDKLATKETDDYALIPRRRVIDKACRIAYQTLIEEIGEEIPVTNEDKIPAPIAKSIQNKVERAIESNMTAYGNLGNDPGDPNDTGVVCYIDPDQEILGSSRLNVQLMVKPYGYAKYIDVSLGFEVAEAN